MCICALFRAATLNPGRVPLISEKDNIGNTYINIHIDTCTGKTFLPIYYCNYRPKLENIPYSDMFT